MFRKKRKGNGFVALIVVGIIGFILFLALNPFVVIESGNVGVKKSFGNVSEKVLGPGLNFRMPIVEWIDQISIKNQSESGSLSSTTKDLQQMTIGYNFVYSLPEEDVVDLYISYQGKLFDSFLKPKIEEAVKTILAKNTAYYLAQNREQVKTEIIKLVKERVGKIVKVKDIAITNFSLSRQLMKAIEKKQIQQQEAQEQKYKLEKARIQQQIEVTEAKGIAEAMRIKGNAIKKNPDVLQVDIIKKWNGLVPLDAKTVVIGSKTLTQIK